MYDSCPPNKNAVSCTTNCDSCLSFLQVQASGNYNCCVGIATCSYEGEVNDARYVYDGEAVVCWDVYVDSGSENGDPNPEVMLGYCVSGAYSGYESAVTAAQQGLDGQEKGCASSESNSLDPADTQQEACLKACT